MSYSKKPIGRMTLVELRAERASRFDGAAQPCKCRPCLNRDDAIEAELSYRERESQPVAPDAEDLSQYDPVMLLAGIKVKPIKQKRQMAPALRIEAGKRLSDMIFRGRTTFGIAQEQDKLDRLRRARGHTVRG